MWFTLMMILACGPKKGSSTETVVPETELSTTGTAPSETSGIRSIELLGQIAINTEFDGFEEATLMRIRRLTIESGGVVAEHEHQSRPGLAYIISGEIVEHRGDEVRTCATGATALEQTGVRHWWENSSESDVVAVVVDILEPDVMPDLGVYSAIESEEERKVESSGLAVALLNTIDLSSEYAALEGKNLRARHIDVAPSGVVAFHQHLSRPSFAYLLNGEMVEHRDDRVDSIVHTAGSVVTERNGLGHWWENTSDMTARFLVVDIVDIEP